MNMLSGAKMHCESTEPENCQMFFFLLPLQVGYISSSMTLSQWFLHKTAAFTLSSVPAHLFSTTLKSHEAV